MLIGGFFSLVTFPHNISDGVHKNMNEEARINFLKIFIFMRIWASSAVLETTNKSIVS